MLSRRAMFRALAGVAALPAALALPAPKGGPVAVPGGVQRRPGTRFIRHVTATEARHGVIDPVGLEAEFYRQYERAVHDTFRRAPRPFITTRRA